MRTFKQGVADWVTVRIEDATGAGITGVVYNSGSLAVKIAKAGAAAVTKTLAAPDWVEEANGYYWIKLTAGDLDTVGMLSLIWIYAGAEAALDARVSQNLEDDTYQRVADLGNDTASIIENQADAFLELARLRALLHDNIYIDQQFFTTIAGKQCLTSARLRAYDTKANADAHGATGLLYTYLQEATYDGSGNCTSYKLTRDA